MVLTVFEKEVLGEVSKERCWEHVKWFAGQGEKLSGTPANERSVDYILDALRGLGVAAEAPRFQAWLGFPRLHDAEVKVLEPEERALECIALAQCASGSAEGGLVYVGGGGLKDYEGVNARNMVVLADFSKPPRAALEELLGGGAEGGRGSDSDQPRRAHEGAEQGDREVGVG